MDSAQHSGKVTTWKPTYDTNKACADDFQLCQNGDCIPTSDSCPEQHKIDENQILKIVVVGTLVFLFMLVLYCFHRCAQQRRAREANTNQNAIVIDGDNVSLNLPPPAYNEVISSDLYPPNPQMQHSARIPTYEEPLTPPPNYDAALRILAHSQENLYSAKNEPSIIRRSVSSDIHPSSPNGASRGSDIDYQRIFSLSENRSS